MPATSTVKPAKKGILVIKDLFIVRHFKLAGTEESGTLIIIQVTEVSVGKVTSTTKQETLQNDEDTSDKNDEDGKGDNDSEGNNNDDGTMDIDTSSLVADVKFLESLHLAEVLQKALIKMMVIEDIALAPLATFSYVVSFGL
ncbi:hypothetical protein C0995_010277 [Termitomyces sp. Mi166|nr:hypothetical protein C0995_010277 [Termitomyces sp. Mi166\